MYPANRRTDDTSKRCFSARDTAPASVPAIKATDLSLRHRISARCRLVVIPRRVIWWRNHATADSFCASVRDSCFMTSASGWVTVSFAESVLSNFSITRGAISATTILPLRRARVSTTLRGPNPAPVSTSGTRWMVVAAYGSPAAACLARCARRVSMQHHDQLNTGRMHTIGILYHLCIHVLQLAVGWYSIMRPTPLPLPLLLLGPPTRAFFWPSYLFHCTAVDP